MDRIAGAPVPAASVRLLGSPGWSAHLAECALRLHAADGITIVPHALAGDPKRVGNEVVPILTEQGLYRPRSVRVAYYWNGSGYIGHPCAAS
jgi:hypothetical protein